METKDLIMTPELKKKLSEFAAITPEKEFRYIPSVYRDNKVPLKDCPVFILKVLDGEELIEVENAGDYHIIYDRNDRHELHGKSGERRERALLLGVKGWKNYKDATGKVIEFNKDSFLRFLSVPLQIDLFNGLKEGTNLTEEETRSLG